MYIFIFTTTLSIVGYAERESVCVCNFFKVTQWGSWQSDESTLFILLGPTGRVFLWEGKGCCRGENSQCRVWCLHCLGKWYEKSCYIVLWIGLMVQESCWVSQTIDSSPFSLHSWLVYFHLQEGAQATLFSIEFHVQFQISVFFPHFLIPKQVGEKIDTEKNSCVPAVAVKVKIKLSKDTGLLISAEKELQRQKVELTG